jgi:Lantibiotic dehydratase, N terminus
VTSDELVPLGDTGWRVWRSAVLRGPGFPASGLDRLAAPDCAKLADAYLAGLVDRGALTEGFDAGVREVSRRLSEIAADPLFREAVAWQSLSSLRALDGLGRSGPDGPRNSKLRQREIVITRYWQRYCGKNDTIGFFGPACWVWFDPDGPAVRARPGPRLVRERVVDLEWRALAEFTEMLAADARFRPWLPVIRRPHLALDGETLLRAGSAPEPLGAAAAALLAAADGTRSASEVVTRVVAAGGLRKEADGFLLLDRLAAQGLLRWGFDPPLSIAAEDQLRKSLGGIGDPDLRAEACEAFERLTGARDELAAAAGDPDAVAAGMRRLEETFVEITGGQAQHRPGATYAGRGVAYEEALRDLELTFGGPVLSTVAPALAPLLRAARWLTVALAGAYETTLRELYDEAVAATGSARVPLGELWVLAVGVMLGDGPGARVLDEFVRRWSTLLGLDKLAPGVRSVQVDSARLASAVDEVFAADAPGWPAGRLHSPDLHLCADSLDALVRGDFTAVLGELHVAWLTCAGGYLTRFHPSPESLRAALHRDVGNRIVLLYAPDVQGVTARLTDTLVGPGDTLLGYSPAPTPTLDDVLALASLTASLMDGRLVAEAPDGRTWPLLELVGPFLSELSVDAFKLAGAGAYTPRVSVDNLVVHRETWRTSIGDTGLAGQPRSELDRYLAVRRWRAELGLPERVFIRVGTEIKPCYVDFTSPAYVAAFLAMIRSGYAAGGADTRLTISELLPTPEQAWLPDAAGNRYFSELRITVVDPAGGPQ